jgi:hypothetical protein
LKLSDPFLAIFLEECFIFEVFKVGEFVGGKMVQALLMDNVAGLKDSVFDCLLIDFRFFGDDAVLAENVIPGRRATVNNYLGFCAPGGKGAEKREVVPFCVF